MISRRPSIPTRRVVVTGLGAVSPLGTDVPTLWQALVEGRTGVRAWPALAEVRGLHCRVAALVPDVDARGIDRKKRRYMSQMSIFATLAAREALANAGLTDAQVRHERTGVCVGSTVGSTIETEEFFRGMSPGRSIEQLKSTHFFKVMNSSCAANLAQALGISGRAVAPSAACATGTIAVGLGAECIAAGKQDVMICGGADELHPLGIGVFDALEAASRSYNDRPEETPRPFDKDRDGIICGEGAGMVVLESLEHAQLRGARVLGEILGFALTSAPDAIASPSAHAIVQCLTTALAESGLSSDRVDHVNAHATGTIQGDEAECLAIEQVLGRDVPVSSLKGHMGHTMAASGALALIATLLMMRNGLLVPTRNLREPDEVCGRLRLLREVEPLPVTVAMVNSFALGGMNSAVVVSGRLLDE